MCATGSGRCRPCARFVRGSAPNRPADPGRRLAPVPGSRRRARGRARAGARHARALRHGVRQRRLVDLLRARPDGRLRARADAARLPRRRDRLRGDRGDLRRGDGALPRGGRLRRASRATRSTSSSASAPPGRRCSSTSSPSPPRRSSSRTTSRSSGSRSTTNPWDIVGGAIVIVVLVALNIVGVTEAAKLSITLAVIDFATQVLLVLLGFVARASAPRRSPTTSTGASRRPGRTSRSRFPSRCSPTRASRPSRTSPRRRATPCARVPDRLQARRASRCSRSTSRCR